MQISAKHASESIQIPHKPTPLTPKAKQLEHAHAEQTKANSPVDTYERSSLSRANATASDQALKTPFPAQEVLAKATAEAQQSSPNHVFSNQVQSDPQAFSADDREAILQAWGARPGDESFDARLDTNSDGVINASDLANVLGSPQSTQADRADEPTKEAILAAWGAQKGDDAYTEALDLDSDGRIGAGDLAHSIGKELTATDPEPRAFGQADIDTLLASFGLAQGDPGFDSRYDLDGDGVINSSDLANALGTIGQAAQARRDEFDTSIQNLLDAFGSRDGDTSFDAGYDMNHDGVINASDLASLLGSQNTSTNNQDTSNTYTAKDVQSLLDSWGANDGQRGFNPRYDFDNDGVITSSDLSQLLGRIGLG